VLPLIKGFIEELEENEGPNSQPIKVKNFESPKHKPTDLPTIVNPTPVRKCLAKREQTNQTPLTSILESYHQYLLLRMLPPQLEHHYIFNAAVDPPSNDPLLIVLVRPRHNFGHEEIYQGLIDSWFNDKTGGVLIFNCSELRKQTVDDIKNKVVKQLHECPESIIIFRYMELLMPDYSNSILDFVHDVGSMSTSVDDHKISGRKAIFLFEVVIGSTHFPHYSSSVEAGRLLFEESTTYLQLPNGYWDLFGIMKHQKKNIKNRISSKSL